MTDFEARDVRLPWQERLVAVFREDTQAIRPRQHLFNLLSRAIPPQVGGDLRATLLRLRGVQVGIGTRFLDTPRITIGQGQTIDNLSIGEHCLFDMGCILDLGAKLTIGDRVTLGHEVILLTTSHELGRREHRAGALLVSPVTIGAGAWLGPRSIVLPGVTVGAGAIVDPGTVVNKDVAPHTRVGGSPPRKLEELAP